MNTTNLQWLAMSAEEKQSTLRKVANLLRFSKKRFKQHASLSVKKALNSHLEVLDGMKVIFPVVGSRFGEIPFYMVNGKGYFLDTVDKEWCE
ncbi:MULTISPECIES: hypothetical protein [Lysinibacillus]|uniref:Uncharacterized protein n=1 Tax=Lysinibacillus capsici TaxID=2115968 RepID=A0A2X0XMH8_9BACI|nr:hypothetical protein [Lysinibacillus capsici]SPT98763.1 Uncharacterised protein [Lysinibacillus capsici]